MINHKVSMKFPGAFYAITYAELYSISNRMIILGSDSFIATRQNISVISIHFGIFNNTLKMASIFMSDSLYFS